MSDPIFVCVRTGTAYDFSYVVKLRNMIERHMPKPFDLVCFTDQSDRCQGMDFIDISEMRLPGWWAKMLIFEPQWRDHAKVIYIDLDTVIIDTLAPLADVPGEFSILQSPVHLAGNLKYPCKYNSSVMVIGAGQCDFVWREFDKRRNELITKHARYGDQACIEELYPDAPFLQDMLSGFFCNYRNLTNHKPKASVVNFAGQHKPHTCPIQWVQEEWR